MTAAATAPVPRCARCGSHEVAVTALDRRDRGTRVAVACEECAAVTEAWLPNPGTAP